jgi:DNA-binding response OmpR family regulator
VKVFALEDDPDRIIWFERYFTKRGIPWKCVQTCSRADEFDSSYDVVLLDHDLGGRQLEEHREDDGLLFLQKIKEDIRADAMVMVHSWNDVAAVRMKCEYPSAVLAEFGSNAFLTILEAVCGR